MEIFDVFSMNGIENYPAVGEIFLENVILKVSQTHFPRISNPRGGAYIFQGGGGGQCPPRGAVKYPDSPIHNPVKCTLPFTLP